MLKDCLQICLAVDLLLGPCCTSTFVVRGDGGLVERTMAERFVVQELLLNGCRPKGVLADKIAERGLGLSYSLLMDAATIHNIDFRQDPPVQSYQQTVASLKAIAGANLAAVWLAGTLLAAGRSVPFQQWMLHSREFREWLQT